MSNYSEWFNTLLDEHEEQLLLEFRKKPPAEQVAVLVTAALLLKDYTEYAAKNNQDIDGLVSAFTNHIGVDRKAITISDDIRLTGVLALLIKAQRDVYAIKDMGDQEPNSENDEGSEPTSGEGGQISGDLR